MNEDSGPLLFCICSITPFLLGVITTLVLQARIRKLGPFWAFVPGAGLFRRLMDRYHE